MVKALILGLARGMRGVARRLGGVSARSGHSGYAAPQQINASFLGKWRLLAEDRGAHILVTW